MAMRVAVIGVGSMGKHHARVYYELPDTDLVAVSDMNSGAAAFGRGAVWGQSLYKLP